MSTAAQPLISPAVRRQTIADALRRTALRLPQKLGIVCGQTAWTYAEFDALVTRLAAGLAGEGVARTDALAVEGIQSALDRAEAYLACGVDALFIEALRTTEQMQQACAQFAHRIPLLANMVEGGQTLIQSATELGERGFRIVIFPGGTARAVAHTLQGYYGSLKAHQTTTPWRDQMLNFDDLNQLIGTPELLALGKKYDGK